MHKIPEQLYNQLCQQPDKQQYKQKATCLINLIKNSTKTSISEGTLNPSILLPLAKVITIVTSMTVMFAMTPVQAAVSNINGITIYQGLASVNRSLPVNTNNSAENGEQILVFSCLSPHLNADSISVQASPHIKLGEISIETLSGEQASQCEYQGDASVKSQRNKLELITVEYDAAVGARSYLQNLSRVTGIEVSQNAATTAASIETKLNDINKRLIVIAQRHQEAEDALNQLMAGNVDFVGDNVTQVSVRTASRQSGEVKLSYQVRGAGWQPTYKAYLDTVTNELKITASAVIAQHTGENWLNIPLVLSAVNPNQRTNSIDPNVSRLSLYERSKDEAVSPHAPVMLMPILTVSADEADLSAKRKDNSSQPLPSFNVSSSSLNGITEYRIPQRISIPSDGRRVTTLIDTQQGTSKLWLRSVPTRETKAYWYVSAPFLTPAWVNGTMQLYRDNNYVGQTTYSYQNLKEQGIGFGIAPNLIVKSLSAEHIEGDSGMMSRTKNMTIEKAYEFTNLYDNTKSLQVLGSEPISQDEDITLKVTHIPPISEQNWNDNNGMVAWEFALAPQQSQVVKSVYEISYPAKKELRGNY